MRKAFNTKPIIFQLETRSFIILSFHFRPPMGRDNSVGIENRYGIDVPGIDSRWGRDFPNPSRLALVPT